MTDQLKWNYDRIHAHKKEMNRERRTFPWATGKKGVLVGDLIALTENRDPFYQGHPTNYEEAKWFIKAWAKCQQNDATRKLNLRRVYYFLGSKRNYKKHDGTILKLSFMKDRLDKEGNPILDKDGNPAQFLSDPDWDYVQNCATSARVLATVDLDEFRDKRNKAVSELNWRGRKGDDPQPARYNGSLDQDMPGINIALADLEIGWSISGPAVVGFDPNDFIDRNFYVEVWPEKGSCDDILIDVCEELRIPYQPGMGYASITQIAALVKRIAAIGKPAILFYISDYDKAGKNMPKATARWIEFFAGRLAPGIPIKVIALALNQKQITDNNLPQAPDGKCELDALEALVPGKLEEIVRRAVAKYIQPLDGKLREVQNRAQLEARMEWDREVVRHRLNLAKLRKRAASIAKRYAKQVARFQADLNKRLGRDMKPFARPLAQLDSEIDAIKFKSKLPPRPKPNLDPPDEADVLLFDSGRDYLEQLPYYKKQQGERP